LPTVTKFIKHPSIQVALTGGICIIVQAYFYKRIFHQELNGLLVAVPALIFGIYQSIYIKDKEDEKGKSRPEWSRPLYWSAAIILTTVLSIAIPYFN
jgi:hypothetical protein